MNIFAMVIVISWLAAVVGWVSNIVQLVGMSFDVITGIFVLKVVGVFVAPLGAVLGLIGLF